MRAQKKTAIFLVSILLATSCLPDNESSEREASGAVFQNTPNSLSAGEGRILADNPIILSNNYNLSINTNLNNFLKRSPERIVLNNMLIRDCQPTLTSGLITPCLQVMQDRNSQPTLNPQARWAYPTDDPRFLEVNLFAHLQKGIERYFELNQILKEQQLPGSPPLHNLSATHFTNAAFWEKKQRPLLGYADCNQLDNSFFAPATFTICMGRDSVFDRFRWAHDPTVIYHELSHAINKIIINARNTADGTVAEEVSLGFLRYDEANAIDEGLADFFSYVMTGRTHIGEWAMGRIYRQSRPMSEDDPIHAPGVNRSFSGRLSYPNYVDYDPNFPDEPFEDIHYAGQIISHYLVALTEDIHQSCSLSSEDSRNLVQMLVYNSLAELGDLTSKGRDSNNQNHINYRPEDAFEWVRINNPINFRSFAQSMARSVKRLVINNLSYSCYSKDQHEKLLDSYGLLLFRSYNESGNNGNPALDTQVLSLNRVKTLLVPKNLIQLNPAQNESRFFAIDQRSSISQAVQSLLASGQISGLSTLIDANLPYNNGNGRISPGEVVGIVPNLYNNSNTQMGGIQVLANDWRHLHTDGKSFCNNDQYGGFPSGSQGGKSCAGDLESETLFAPSCMVQVTRNGAARWSVQSELMNDINLTANHCLGGGQGNNNECFLRAIRGADQATFSRIDPKKTWAQTASNEDGSPKIQINHLLFFEVSPWTPPGTVFNCRFRVRFTNCDDCFHDKDNDRDYFDVEYAGARPFKLINFQFTVVD